MKYTIVRVISLWSSPPARHPKPPIGGVSVFIQGMVFCTTKMKALHFLKNVYFGLVKPIDEPLILLTNSYAHLSIAATHMGIHVHTILFFQSCVHDPTLERTVITHPRASMHSYTFM